MSIKNLPRTTRTQFIKALVASFDSLPQYATIENWAKMAEKYFANDGMKVYCHKTVDGDLSSYASSHGESDRYDIAESHCDIEDDIAVLNQDTNDRSGEGTDQEYPRPEKSIFFNRPSKPEYICISYDKLRRMGDAIEAGK